MKIAILWHKGRKGRAWPRATTASPSRTFTAASALSSAIPWPMSIPPVSLPHRRHPATRAGSVPSSSSPCWATLRTPTAAPISSSTGNPGRSRRRVSSRAPAAVGVRRSRCPSPPWRLRASSRRALPPRPSGTRLSACSSSTTSTSDPEGEWRSSTPASSSRATTSTRGARSTDAAWRRTGRSCANSSVPPSRAISMPRCRTSPRSSIPSCSTSTPRRSGRADRGSA